MPSLKSQARSGIFYVAFFSMILWKYYPSITLGLVIFSLLFSESVIYFKRVIWLEIWKFLYITYSFVMISISGLLTALDIEGKIILDDITNGFEINNLLIFLNISLLLIPGVLYVKYREWPLWKSAYNKNLEKKFDLKCGLFFIEEEWVHFPKNKSALSALFIIPVSMGTAISQSGSGAWVLYIVSFSLMAVASILAASEIFYIGRFIKIQKEINIPLTIINGSKESHE